MIFRLRACAPQAEWFVLPGGGPGIKLIPAYRRVSRFGGAEARPGSPGIHRDVRQVSGNELKSEWQGGEFSLLAGCAPCQPFSTYSRKGRRLRPDSKWELVGDFGRLVGECQPDFVTMENVPQLLEDSVFSGLLDALSDYCVWYSVVECARYGIPQTRKRLVLLASKLGRISLIPPSSLGDRTTATVRDAISHLPRLSAGQTDPGDNLHAASRLSRLNLRRIRASKPGGSWRDWNSSLISPCHRRKTGDTYPSVYGRMEWDFPSPTITTQCYGYGSGRFGHPEQDRAISLREAAILQTFPETYRFTREGEPARFSILGRLIGMPCQSNWAKS